MSEGFLDVDGFHLAYAVAGHGPELAIAFHGFGTDHSQFDHFAEQFGDRFTTYMVDLFFHGKSTFPAGRGSEDPISASEFRKILLALLQRSGRDSACMIGYSLGGRLALSALELLPEHCSRAILLAPDGLVHRPWYRMAAHYRLGRWMFARWIERPGIIDLSLRSARKSHLIGELLYQFISMHTDTRERRILVREVWQSLRSLEPDLEKVGDGVRNHGIPVHLFLGKHDRLIPVAAAERFRKLAPGWIDVHILQAGHALLLRPVIPMIKQGLAKGKGAVAPL